ncbi:MAG: hypothetical protein JWQ85_424 [Mucilaginibacter sp.]|nr:hypothetical protein [Mucilaginibacter sp.]
MELPAAGLCAYTAQALATGRYPLLSLTLLTHPVVAALDHPLFAARKEGLKKPIILHPLCAAERVDQRSVVGVSK